MFYNYVNQATSSATCTKTQKKRSVLEGVDIVIELRLGVMPIQRFLTACLHLLK